MEATGAEATLSQVKAVDGEDNIFQDKESRATAKERGEAALFGLENTAPNGAINPADLAPPKDAVDEWPEPKQTHSFFFVKVRPYEDPNLKMKLDQADKECQKKIQARSHIFEALRTKRNERSNIISELKPLTAENKQYNVVVSGKLKEIEPLQKSLGKFRSENNAMRAQGAGLCSSIEELDQLIKSLNDRICHESISLDEEKRLVKEIKQLNGTRSKVVENAAKRAKMQDTVGERDTIHDQVKQIGVGIDEVKKERQNVRDKIKVLEDQLHAVDDEIAALQDDLTAATARKDKAFDALNELRKTRDLNNVSFHQYRTISNNVRDLSARGEVEMVQQLCQNEVEKFMAQWGSSKSFREDYEKRILVSLNSRQLSRDGRMRNPDEKPIVLETQVAPPAEHEPAPLKKPVKQAKEAPAPPADITPKDEIHVKAPAKTAKAKPSLEVGDIPDVYDDEAPKEKTKPKVVDEAKLKEMKRQEEIEKNKLALERKKKHAEKQAMKAVARAEKEAERKLKEKEKKAKKKSAAAGGAESEEAAESDAKSDEAVEPEVKGDELEAPATVKKEQKKNPWHKTTVTKTKAPLPKAVLKRKKSQSYMSWIAPAGAFAAVLVVLLGVVVYYQHYYYLPASTSN
ncbi:proton pump-interactor BIP131 [Oryza brachyantha]|uniref:Proton pump-interactor 1 n=1 Tax=Oryza brachyantha TaxID=4533 RepID=J3MSR7_ORYBR|nr:proton pump-interactor BIP131 [Oryza brachyantha]